MSQFPDLYNNVGPDASLPKYSEEIKMHLKHQSGSPL